MWGELQPRPHHRRDDRLGSFGCRSVQLALNRGVALNRFAVDLDAANVRPAAGAVAAAGHQVREADLVHLAEIRMLDPLAVGRLDDLLDIELAPADVGERDFFLMPVDAETVGVIADEPGSIGQLYDRPE